MLSPNGVTPIACVPQAHVAVVLCKHNPTDYKFIFIFREGLYDNIKNFKQKLLKCPIYKGLWHIVSFKVSPNNIYIRGRIKGCFYQKMA